MSLEILVHHGDERTLRLTLDGELDATTSVELEAALAKNLLAATRVLVFDLSGLRFVSSAGLRVFAKARKQIRQQQGAFYCANPSPQVRKVFEIVKATPLAEVFTSVEELDDYLKAMQERIGPAG